MLNPQRPTENMTTTAKLLKRALQSAQESGQFALAREIETLMTKFGL